MCSAPRCGKAGIVEHDGSVYSCDHFMYPQYRLGNLATDDLAAMMDSPAQRAFGDAGLNYLCAGYKKYFHHVTPAMNIMARLLGEGRSADGVMEQLAH